MKYLDEKLNGILKENRIAGMAVAITDREKIVYAKGFGVDNAERADIPASADAMYRIASITKVVTGITILRLAEEGVLSLDTPVREYVPWLRFSRPEALEQMTMRHLLSHTSGLPAEYTPEGPREESALEQSLKDGLPSLELKTLPNEGTYLYSNWGIRLASYIAQIRTGRPYSELAQEYVLDPLGMHQTTFDLRVAATYPLSLPHEDAPDGSWKVVHWIKENAARLAAGGLYSNVFDLCKLARFLLNSGKTDEGQQLLSGESMTQMFRKIGKRPSERDDWYGLTLMHRQFGEGYLYGHLGSAPPYALSMLTDPLSGYGVAVLMNTERKELRYSIPEMIFEYLRTKE